jgi:anti-sigma factor RsiW
MNAMTCQDVLDRVAPYLDHELGRAERELVERHLEGCASCSAIVEKLAEQELRPPPVSDAVATRIGAPDFWSAMDARLASEVDAQLHAPRPATARSFSVSWKVAFAYAAALAIAMLWGAHAHRETMIARAENESLLRQLDRVQALADSQSGVPSLPAPAAPTTPVRTVPSQPQAQSDLELAGYTPHRGTF